MTRLVLILFALTLMAAPAEACFGPKLYVGIPAGAQGDALFGLVSLYVKEKTGTEMVRVGLDGRDPRALLAAEELDLALAEGEGGEGALLVVAGAPSLLAGRRPLEDLQFTTVAPALRRLQKLLQPADVASLVAAVRAGEGPVAAARRLLMDRGWI